MSHRRDAGFTMVEVLIALTVLMLTLGGLAGLLIQNARVNKNQQLTVEAQANARNCLSMVVQKLRSAGWDPLNTGAFPAVTLDANGMTDNISQIEVYADFNPEDGDAADPEEQVLIRHVGDTVEWRPGASASFVTLAVNISNDANGDGTPEPMFTPDSTVNPTRILVQITAQSPVPDPATGDFVRYTVTSEVHLRGA